MQRDETKFIQERNETAKKLDDVLVTVDPRVALAAALRIAAVVALRSGARRGLLGPALDATYEGLRVQLSVRTRELELDARPLADVVPFRRAV